MTNVSPSMVPLTRIGPVEVLSMRRLASLVVAVAVVIGFVYVGKQWMERQALSAVLGPGTTANALKLHLKRNAGCAEQVQIPLAFLADPGDGLCSTLTANRLWFTYDLNALLRKRFVLKQVVMDDALITFDKPVPDRHLPQRLSEWPGVVSQNVKDLRQDRFLTQSKSFGMAEKFSNVWRSETLTKEQRVKKILQEAKQIQQALSARDNPLRNEQQVKISVAHLDSLYEEVDQWLNQVANVEKQLRDQQAEMRRTLLDDKNALKELGEKFECPSALPHATEKLKDWICTTMDEPSTYAELLASIISKPFQGASRGRGNDIRHSQMNAADIAVESAKIVGEIQKNSHKISFLATGKFDVVNRFATSDENLSSEGANWRMSIGSDPESLSLEGTSLEARSGRTSVKANSGAAGKLQAEFVFESGGVNGSGNLGLREWLSSRNSAFLETAEKLDVGLVIPLDDKLIDTEKAPEQIAFRFQGAASEMHISLEPDSSNWLATQLETNAAHCVEQEYLAAIERLTARVESDLLTLQRSAYDARDRAQSRLKQAREELKSIRLDINQSLAERSGTRYARQPDANGAH